MGMCGMSACAWVAFSILERGILSAYKKRGMLERSDKPWGEGGGADISERASTCSSSNAGAPFPPPQACSGGRARLKAGVRGRTVCLAVESSSAPRWVLLPVPKLACLNP